MFTETFDISLCSRLSIIKGQWVYALNLIEMSGLLIRFRPHYSHQNLTKLMVGVFKLKELQFYWYTLTQHYIVNTILFLNTLVTKQFIWPKSLKWCLNIVSLNWNNGKLDLLAIQFIGSSTAPMDQREAWERTKKSRYFCS